MLTDDSDDSCGRPGILSYYFPALLVIFLEERPFWPFATWTLPCLPLLLYSRAPSRPLLLPLQSPVQSTASTTNSTQMSKLFCCCLPVRFGVFVLSLLTLLSSAGTAFALWWILVNGTCSRCPSATLALLLAPMHTATRWFFIFPPNSPVFVRPQKRPSSGRWCEDRSHRCWRCLHRLRSLRPLRVSLSLRPAFVALQTPY